MLTQTSQKRDTVLQFSLCTWLTTLHCVGATRINATSSYLLVHDKLTVALSMGNSINPVEILNLSLDLDLSVCGGQNAMKPVQRTCQQATGQAADCTTNKRWVASIWLKEFTGVGYHNRGIFCKSDSIQTTEQSFITSQ